MPVPKYDEIMLPLLKALSDGKEHPKSELVEKMADHFNLSLDMSEGRFPPLIAQISLGLLIGPAYG